MTHEIIQYYLSGWPRKNSTTGQTMPAQDLGPYAVGIRGSFWRNVARAEVVEYVKRMHGRKPTRIEYHPIAEEK